MKHVILKNGAFIVVVQRNNQLNVKNHLKSEGEP